MEELLRLSNLKQQLWPRLPWRTLTGAPSGKRASPQRPRRKLRRDERMISAAVGVRIEEGAVGGGRAAAAAGTATGRAGREAGAGAGDARVAEAEAEAGAVVGTVGIGAGEEAGAGNAISTPFQRCFNAISTPLQCYFNAIITLS